MSSSSYFLLTNPFSSVSGLTHLRRPFTNARFGGVDGGGVRIAASLNVEVKAPDLSKEVMEESNKVFVGTYARAPLVLTSGKGCKLYDIEGREYLDLTSGIAVNALGHGDPDWIRAVSQQANTLTHVSNLYYTLPQVNLSWALVLYLFGIIVHNNNKINSEIPHLGLLCTRNLKGDFFRSFLVGYKFSFSPFL